MFRFMIEKWIAPLGAKYGYKIKPPSLVPSGTKFYTGSFKIYRSSNSTS